jgi:hypothetical protein
MLTAAEFFPWFGDGQPVYGGVRIRVVLKWTFFGYMPFENFARFEADPASEIQNRP